ncbi:YpdA family putative bacillithiol disulfide reductase [Paenibacillus sp. FSL H8-0537]|uniref:YpdA family putative bacillithiol disulfide reductase n=1 Tax=Paenibacillus sp. FSL H8-0537 TaxID=2921399 RepID=UPI003100EF84
MKDVIIIGGGPCGIATAIEAKKNNLDYLVLEKGCIVNHITQFPTYVTLFGACEDFEIGGVPFTLDYGPPRKKDAMRYYYKVVKHFDLDIHQYEEVTHVEQVQEGNDRFYTVTSQQRGQTNVYRARNVVFATGFVSNPRKLGIDGEELPKVLHLFTEAHFFANQKVLIIGTGHSGLEAIIDLCAVDAQVTLVHRGDNLSYTPKRWMLAEARKLMDAGQIKAHFSSTVTAIEQDRVHIHTPDGPIAIENDFVLKLVGFQPQYEMLDSLGVQFSPDTGAPLFNDGTMESNVPGIYVAGVYAGGRDVNTYQISTGRFHASKIITNIARRIGILV